MIKRSVLCQLVGQEGTKHHKFLKNYCLQHVWKAIHGNLGNTCEKSNKCNQCDYASSRAGELRTHFKTHSLQKSNKWSQCDCTLCLFLAIIKERVGGGIPQKCNFQMSGRPFEETFENAHWGRRQTNATDVTLNPLVQALLKHIWKRTMEKSKTNVTNVTLHPLMQALWKHIWKCSMEKSKQCNQCDYEFAHVGSLRTHFKTHKLRNNKISGVFQLLPL